MKKMTLILLLGLVVRLLLIPLTFHPDFRSYNLAGFLIAQKGQVLGFYDYISQLPRSDRLVEIYTDGQFNYPPLAYLSHGVFNFILGPFYPWEAFDRLLFDYDNFRSSAGSVPLLYLLKLPYLLADIGCLVILRKFFTNARNKELATVLWIFNPLTLYSAYMMGQFDIFITLFMIWAAWLSSLKKTWAAAVCLGIAAGFKPISLALLPFIGGSKVKNIGIGLATYLLIISPYLGSVGFKHYALFATQLDKPLYAKIMVSGSQYLPLFIVGYVLLLWWHWFKHKTQPDWYWMMTPLALFFMVTHFHPQWFAWIAPFFVLAWVNRPQTKFPLAAILAAYALIVFLFEPSLNFGLFGIDFNFYNWINARYSAELLASLARGALAGSLITHLLVKET